MHTLAEGAVLTAGLSSAVVNISDSVFYNNSAVQGGIFNVETESVIRCTNCKMMNNFALSSSIIRVVTSGYFEFYNCSITENIAKDNLISLLFDTVNLSIFSKCQIFSNILMSPTQLYEEVNDR